MSWTKDELNIFSCNFARALSGGDEKFRFTGWKDKDGDEGFVSQWLDWHDATDLYYVNIPSMDHGSYERGGELTIGDARIFLSTPQSHVSELIRNGFLLLCANRGYSGFGLEGLSTPQP